MICPLFGQGLVVHFVLQAHRLPVRRGGFTHETEALVDKQFMDQEVGQTVGGNAKTKVNHRPHLVDHTEHDAQPTGDGEY